MNHSPSNDIKLLLLDRRSQLLVLISEHEGQLRMRSEKLLNGNEPAIGEMIDMAQMLEQQDRDAKLEQQERRELASIERALTKMATGQFGTCESCEEEIPPRRLLALPEARFCTRCQALDERENQRHSRGMAPGIGRSSEEGGGAAA
jgi:DnaK suppressor protein